MQDKDIWEMNNEEKLDTCEKLREKGNFYFKVSLYVCNLNAFTSFVCI